jgi:small-conductance mechanosensitive channel
MLILAALREHKIEIPYPQRVMHMVGGAKPAEA